MLGEYVACGFDPDLFWRSTPREVAAHFKGARLRAEREHQARAWASWHTAALPLARKFPAFEDFIGRRRKARPKGPEELQAMIATWGGRKDMHA